MIWFSFILIVVLLVLYEYFGREKLAGHIGVRYETDMQLVEPDETITFTYTVYNSSFLPAMYVGLSVCFDDCVTIREPEEWCKKHVSQDWRGSSVEQRLFLLPHRKYIGHFKYSIGRRGVHLPDRIYIETGDYFGMRSYVSSVEPTRSVVCTAHMVEDMAELPAAGGYMGDISVRRFIFEDPNLITGYRDYTGHEPLKQISWQQTARYGQLTVKQYDHTVDRDVTVIVSLNMQINDKNKTERTFELARTVCEQLEERRIAYEFISNTDIGHITKGLGRLHLETILARIGRSRGAAFVSFGELVDRCMNNRLTDSTFVIVIPEETEDIRAQLRRLQTASTQRLYVLTPEGEVSV